jgi:hypothetical protein
VVQLHKLLPSLPTQNIVDAAYLTVVELLPSIVLFILTKRRGVGSDGSPGDGITPAAPYARLQANYLGAGGGGYLTANSGNGGLSNSSAFGHYGAAGSGSSNRVDMII